MPTPISDADARRAIKEDLDTTLVVEAAAGTGKTTELVTRILETLATGRAAIGQIVAVTFTEKAAGELKLRLREAIEKRRARERAADTRARLEDALRSLEDAHVNTIHGFCAELLRERPVEAGVDPLFTVLTEAQAGRLYARAFRTWLQTALDDPPEGLRRALRRVPQFGFDAGREDDGPIDRLRRAGWTLADWRSFTAPWQRPPFDRTRAIDALIDQLHRTAALTESPVSDRDGLFADTDAVRRLSRQIQLEQSFGQSDHDGWEGRLAHLARDYRLLHARKGSGARYSDTATRADVAAARERLVAALQQFAADADADLAACLQQELAGATARYEALKVAAGALDFTDLLVRTRDLVAGNAAVRAHLQKKFVRIFVDEFQDTDSTQAEILLLLSADDPGVSRGELVRPKPGKLFIVGDPKQAIYRFRSADVGTYWRVTRQVMARGGRVLTLSTSYRSLPAIQRFVNAAFAPEMTANDATLQAPYVPLVPDRDDESSQPAIVALPVPRPYATRRYGGAAIERSLPDAVGAFVAWLVDDRNGWRVTERSPAGVETRVPIQPRHIAILFRRFTSWGTDTTRRYLDALDARGVPHLLVGGKAFHDREEIETMRAALAAIEWPDDELSIFATLKGSLFAIDDAHLLEYRHRFKVLHPFRIPRVLGGNSGEELELSGDPVAHLAPIAGALRALQHLHRSRNYRPVADTIGRLLENTRAHVGFILRPGGEQALANVLHVAELARQYEAGGGISFRGFIEELREAGQAEAAEAPILEESSDGVRVLTAHKAKGLEFPIVILADLTCRMSRDGASRYLDASRNLCALKLAGWAPWDLREREAEEAARDAAEGVRLAYVAATRARDLLVVPALGDGPWKGGWLDPLNRAIYPPLDDRRRASRGPACPAFASKDSVLERPDDEPARAETVAPGWHVFAEGYGVAWWDPRALDLGAKPPSGVRRDDLIVKDVPRAVVADGRTKYDAWKVSRIETREAGATPTLTVATAREWTSEAREERAIPGVDDVSVLRVGDDLARGGRAGGGAAFGALVHAVLARAPFGATQSQLETIAGVEARLLGADTRDGPEAAARASRVLAHALLRRAHAADARGRCRRECPVSLVMEGGTLVEGVVDLAFEDDEGWTVVDYKTDREFEEAVEPYRRQVAFYALAIARATGRPATGVILRI